MGYDASRTGAYTYVKTNVVLVFVWVYLYLRALIFACTGVGMYCFVKFCYHMKSRNLQA